MKSMALDDVLKEIPVIDQKKEGLIQVLDTESNTTNPPFTHFVRYELLRVSQDGQRIYGNWSRSFAGACGSRDAHSYLYRSSLRDYNFEGRCPDHNEKDDGIWSFNHV